MEIAELELVGDEKKAAGETSVKKQGDIRIMPQNTKHRFMGLVNSLIPECSKPDIMSDSVFDDSRISETISRFINEQMKSGS